MSDNLGSLGYDVRIHEDQLAKDIEKIEKQLSDFNKKATKLMSIDAQKTSRLIEEQKRLRAINVTESQRVIQAERLNASKAKTAGIDMKNADASYTANKRSLIVEEQLRQSKLRTVAAQERLNALQRKSIVNATKTNSAYKKQSLYLQNLHTMAANYVSIFAALNLGRSIAQITGEFELQRKALAAIIQSKDEADKLFNKVTDLALESPFAIKGLLGYTKMLAAYRIESENLIPTLTKLGDVSAGLGVDMGRLILAFGQVKAASVLRGQEVRQFTEAGIPVIGLLADKFSELEGRVVSTNEVFDKISKRMVSFQMVSDIFDDMTAKGGLFFDAQRVQAETLAGMMSIFTDAMHKAFAGIGDYNEGFFKGLIGGATELLENWRSVLSLLKVLVYSLGTYRVAMLLLNKQRKVSAFLIANNVKSMKTMDYATKRLAVNQGLAGSATVRLNKGMKALKATMAANIWVLAATAIAGIGVAVYEAYRETTRFNRELDELLTKSANTATGLSRDFKNIANAAVEAADGSEAQRNALDDLRRAYGKYLPKQDLDIENLKKLKGGYDELTEAINKKAAAQARDKGFNLAAQEFNKASSEATDAIFQGLVDQDILEADAKNIVKIFKREILENPDINPAKILQDVTSEYLDQSIMLFAENVERIGTWYSDAATGALKYSNSLYKLKESQDQVESKTEIKFGLNTQELKAEREAIEAIEKTYKDRTKALDDMVLSEEELSAKRLELTKRELIAKLGYYSTVAKGEDDAYSNKRISQYTKELKALNNEGGAYEKLISKIIKENRGDDESIGVKLEVLEGEDTAVHMKRIVSEYKDYKKLITQTEGTIKAYRSTQQEGWEEAVAVAEKELNGLKDNLTVTESIANALGLVIKTKKELKDSEGKALTNIKEQYKLYKEIIKAGKERKEVMGSDQTNIELDKIYGEQAKALNVEIPVSFDAESVVNSMKEMADRAEALGGDAGKKFATGLRTEAATIKSNELISEVKKGLSKIDEEIQNFKNKNNLYKYIFGVTKDESFSFKIAFDTDTKGLEEIIRDQIDAIDTGVGLKVKGDVVGKSFSDIFSESDIKDLEDRLGVGVVKELRKAFAQLKEVQENSFKDELNTLEAALDATESNEQKILKIKEKYIKLRAALELKYANLSSEELAKRIKRANELESDEIAGVTATILASTDAYKALYSDMEKYSIKKMKGIAKVWDEILDKADASTADNKGKKFFEFEDLDGTLKKIGLTEKQIEKLRKTLLKLKDDVTNKSPFEKISEGFNKLAEEGGAAEGLAYIADGVGELLDMLNPAIDALADLADATGDTGMANFADDLSIAAEWGKTLTQAVAGIASGDPVAIIGSIVDITSKLLQAEAEYQRAKRAFVADSIKMQREYVILLLQERALFAEGTSIFGLNEFGGVANNLGVLKDATKEYSKEILNLGDAMVKTGVKRKKVFGITVGKKDVYGQLLANFPEIIKNQDDIIKKTKEWNIMGIKLNQTMYSVGENAEIDINVAKSILATEKLNDETRKTLEQLIALQEEIDAANEAISDYLSNVFGDIGTEISDAMINAFKTGEDAGQAFADSMSNTMDKLAQDIANSMILAPYFKEFENELNEIYKNINLSPEQQLAESAKLMASFYAGLKGEQEEYNKFLKQSQDIAAQYGIDLFSDANDDLSALSNGLESLSEDTGRKIEALLNSTREVNIQMSAKISLIVDGIHTSNNMNGQILSIMQTMNQNLVGYIKTFNEIVVQGSAGKGIKTYVQ